MKTLSTILAALVLLVGQQMSKAASGTVPSTGTGGGNSVTGSVVVTSPLVLANGTNVQLPLILANLATNSPFTNVSQIFSNIVTVNPTANVLTNGILLTNAVKYAATLASASRPILVRIMPGTYGTPTNTMPSVMWAVDNVSTYWEPGAVWWSGTMGGDAAWQFDDQTAARTNCNVYGRGRFFITNDSINVFYVEKESRVRFECESMWAGDGFSDSPASPFTWGGVTNDIDVVVHDYMESGSYDAFYGSLSAGQRIRLKAKTVRAVGDIFEFADDSPQWGNVIIDIDRAEQTSSPGQLSFLQMAGRVHARVGQIKVASLISSMAANGATNGILQGAIIELPPNGTKSVIQDTSPGSWHTGIWLRDCVIIGPTNVDALTLTNIATVPTILENTTIRPGWASTNWARGRTPSNVKIVGGFNLDPYKPLGSQVTVISTNYLPAIRNIGTLVQHGVSFFSNTVTVAADMTVGGTLNGDAGSFNSITAINQFNLPNGAGPFAPGEGDVMFDTDYWGAGRGAFVTWDGTANVVIPALLQSDTPVNGQVLTFNTGGTWTAETPSAGSGSTQMVTAAIGTLTVSNTITQLGSGAAAASSSYYETNGTLYSQLLAPNHIQTNNVLILPTNATAGVMVAQPAGTGTNQIANVALTAGQYVTYNGTAYVASNLPSGGGSGDITSVGDVTSGAAFDGTAGTILQFEGATADGNEVSLTTDDPTADATVTIPAITGDVPVAYGRSYRLGVTNSTTETTIYTNYIPAGVLGTTRSAEVKIRGEAFNNPGGAATATWTLKVYVGGVVIYEDTSGTMADAANKGPFHITMTFQAPDSTTGLDMIGLAVFSVTTAPAATTGSGNFTTDEQLSSAAISGISTASTTTNLPLRVTATLSAADASTWIYANGKTIIE